MIYCVDTSAWLDGWARDYPPDVFPSLWEKLAERVADGVLKCSEEVYVEIEKKDDGLHGWLKTRNIRCITFLEMLRELGWKF